MNILGQKFGRLVVQKFNGKNKHGQFLWECKCDCGEECISLGHLLRTHKKKSCGCIRNPSEKDYLKSLKDRLEKYSHKVGDCLEWKVKNRMTSFGS